MPAPEQAAPARAGRPAGWPGQFAQVIVEILAGARPSRQLIALTTETARARIRLLAAALAADQPPKIKRVMTSWPTEQVVEMTVIVSCGVRSRALAMRLEYFPARPASPGLPTRPARWLCTEVETG